MSRLRNRLPFLIVVGSKDFCRCSKSQKTIEIILWGDTHMTSAKFSDFLTPSPLVRKSMQPPLLSFITLSAFEGTPLPPQCGRHICIVPNSKSFKTPTHPKSVNHRLIQGGPSGRGINTVR